MKNRIFKITTLLFAFTALMGCDREENVIEIVDDGVTYGAFLRTKINDGSYNSYDPTSNFDIDLEYQDNEGSTLLETVDFYLSFIDKNENGNSKPETLVTTLTAADFTKGAQYGLPESGFDMTLQEAATLLGLSESQYTGNDIFKIRVDLKLTDGRIFTEGDGNGNIAGIGGYYSSPYAYEILVECLPLSPIPGDYVLEMNDTKGNGWEGALITVNIDGVSTDYTVVAADGFDLVTYTINVPDGTTTLEFSYTEGEKESEHAFKIKAPNGEVAAESPGKNGNIRLLICS